MSALSVREVSVQYGELTAVNRVSFELKAGRITGVIGPNGAGKTSLIDALSGFARAATGSVHLAGREITGEAPHVRSQLGLSRTWQSGELYEDLTVEQNLITVADRPRWWAMLGDMFRPGRQVTHERTVAELIATLGLTEYADEMIDEIPQDKRKLVGIGRALAMEPKVVMLDEPAAGLDKDETAQLGVELRRIASSGLAMLLVEHDMELVNTVCDELLAIDFGKTITQGAPGDVINDERVIAAYLGDGDLEVAEDEGSAG